MRSSSSAREVAGGAAGAPQRTGRVSNGTGRRSPQAVWRTVTLVAPVAHGQLTASPVSFGAAVLSAAASATVAAGDRAIASGHTASAASRSS